MTERAHPRQGCHVVGDAGRLARRRCVAGRAHAVCPAGMVGGQSTQLRRAVAGQADAVGGRRVGVAAPARPWPGGTASTSSRIGSSCCPAAVPSSRAGAGHVLAGGVRPVHGGRGGCRVADETLVGVDARMAGRGPDQAVVGVAGSAVGPARQRMADGWHRRGSDAARRGRVAGQAVGAGRHDQRQGQRRRDRRAGRAAGDAAGEVPGSVDGAGCRPTRESMRPERMIPKPTADPIATVATTARTMPPTRLALTACFPRHRGPPSRPRPVPGSRPRQPPPAGRSRGRHPPCAPGARPSAGAARPGCRRGR